MSNTEHGMTAIGVLALELAGGTAPARAALSPGQAGALADGCLPDAAVDLK